MKIEMGVHCMCQNRLICFCSKTTFFKSKVTTKERGAHSYFDPLPFLPCCVLNLYKQLLVSFCWASLSGLPGSRRNAGIGAWLNSRGGLIHRAGIVRAGLVQYRLALAHRVTGAYARRASVPHV